MQSTPRHRNPQLLLTPERRELPRTASPTAYESPRPCRPGGGGVRRRHHGVPVVRQPRDHRGRLVARLCDKHCGREATVNDSGSFCRQCHAGVKAGRAANRRGNAKSKKARHKMALAKAHKGTPKSRRAQARHAAVGRSSNLYTPVRFVGRTSGRAAHRKHPHASPALTRNNYARGGTSRRRNTRCPRRPRRPSCARGFPELVNGTSDPDASLLYC